MVESLRISIVQFAVRLVTLVVFVGLFEHREDEHQGESPDHRRGPLRTEGHRRQDGNHKEVDICGSLELVQEG